MLRRQALKVWDAVIRKARARLLLCSTSPVIAECEENGEVMPLHPAKLLRL